MCTIMKMKGVVACLAFILLAIAIELMFVSETRADDEFSLLVTANGADISDKQTIVIDPEEPLLIDLRIFDVNQPITIKELSMTVTFGGQDILTRTGNPGDYFMAPGDVYHQELIIDVGDELKVGDRLLVTGIYRTLFNVEYTVEGRAMVWSRSKNLKIPGNPLNTPMGMGGMAVGLGTATAFLFLFRSLAVPGLPAGTTLPSNASVEGLARLYRFASERLEPTARGRVTGSIVDAARRRIMKDKCPICETRLKHGYCFTCKKSAREVRNEYADKLKALCLQGAQLIASSQVNNLNDLCSKLNITGKLATDVIATLRHSRLVKVKGITRKLTGKAITAGIGTGLSTIIWVTIGGFAVLSAPVLIGILVASVVIPLAVTKGLQIKARHDIRKNTGQAVET